MASLRLCRVGIRRWTGNHIRMKNCHIVGRIVAFALALAVWAPVTVGVTAVSGATQAEAQVIIRDIRVQGNRRIEAETVRSYLVFVPGDRYDAVKVDQSLKALFSTGLFADVNIRLANAIVIVTVVENPIIRKVAFEGNSEVKDDDLRAQVQLKPRSIYTRSRVQSDVQAILDLYRRQGYFAATVDAKIIRLDANRVDLVFEINEGRSTVVKSINFIGNRAFSDSQLRDVITTSESGLFGFLKSTDVYDPDRLRLDRELLRQFYLKNGYADVRIISAFADLDADGTGFFITFTIEEGEPYTFGAIRIESSVYDIDTSRLYNVMLTEEGDTYNASLIDKTIEAMTLEVNQLGYAFARVVPRANRDPIARTIGITYSIVQGPRIYVERINIFGNTRTKDYVIRREFRLAEGDAFNRVLIDQAKRRLQALRFFKKVEIRREPGSAPDRIILNVIVVEQSTGEVSFGAGYSTAEGIIGDIAITERNLMGNGQFVRLKLSGSLERAQVEFSFTEPRFLDYNLAAGFDLFHKEVDFTDESSFKSRRTGGGLRLGFPLTENLRILTRYTLVREEVFDVSDDASVFVKASEGTTVVSALGYTLSYDKLNHPRKPTKGYYLVLTQDLAGVGGDVSYLRTVAEGRAYYPITEKVTFVTRLQGGHIAGLDDEAVRLQDLFFKGPETIRGFERAGFSPRDAATDDAIGGKLYWAFTAEVRFPLPFVPDEIGLKGAVFFDAGSLWDATDVTKITGLETVTVLDSSKVRSSVGASLIWDSPFGPLRLDGAYVLSDEPWDQTQSVRFGAATNF